MKPPRPGTERSADPASPETTPHPARVEDVWEVFLSRDNLTRALRRVEVNRGAPGPDGMTVEQLRPHLKTAWPELRKALDTGTYRPAPVRRVTIPKPDGGERELGVPTVTDRFLQQALSQVLSPIFEPTFSDRSFGFRPGRSAHQAVMAARAAIEAGETWVVDVDLERFFDRVQHDALMARVARRVGDRRVLRLIRRYLDAGVMVGGVRIARTEGTPQGSPLSPLLANIMLDDLDHELERRGHTFVRYADDLRVYVASERAAQRVLDGITVFVEQRLHLRVNQAKSGTASATVRGLLGFGFYRSHGRMAIRLGPKTKARLRARLREITDRHRSIAMPDRVCPSQPVPRWLDGLLRPGRDAFGVQRVRRVAEASSPAGPLEGMEALPYAAAKPSGAGHPRPQSSPVGEQPEGLLAHVGFACFAVGHADRVLDQAWPGADRRTCPSSSGALANRRMRTRTSGGVGGAGLTPAPTRIQGRVRQAYRGRSGAPRAAPGHAAAPPAPSAARRCRPRPAPSAGASLRGSRRSRRFAGPARILPASRSGPPPAPRRRGSPRWAGRGRCARNS